MRFVYDDQVEMTVREGARVVLLTDIVNHVDHGLIGREHASGMDIALCAAQVCRR